MMKRVLYFGNPYRLRLNQGRMVLFSEEENNLNNRIEGNTLSIEDIGVVILDHPKISLSSGLMEALLENNVALVTCNGKHLPQGLLLNLDGHSLQSRLFRAQLESSEPLRKSLWQQTIKAKMNNQAAYLEELGLDAKPIRHMIKQVKSGDPENIEGRASYHYWQTVFQGFDWNEEFRRGREGAPPNAWLNYAYAILRAIVARSLVGSGMLPTWGIHHRNQYNAYCLADDIMEPYRPYADRLVRKAVEKFGPSDDLPKEVKAWLLKLSAITVTFDDQTSPLMIGVYRTTASLARCFEGELRRIRYPDWGLDVEL